ncbi:MAG: hypothetical protein RR420_00770 [Anaerovoracaceae bacterium]
MINIDKVSVSDIFGTNFLHITWTINGFAEDLSEYVFDVLRSTNETQDFVPIKQGIKIFEYKDTNVKLNNMKLQYFYKVRVRNIYNHENHTSDTATNKLRNNADIYATGIVNTYSDYLSSVINNKNVRVLIKRNEGTTCTCYDEIRERSRDRECTKCYGTGILGGYFQSEDLKVCYQNTSGLNEEFQATELRDESEPISAWSPNFPLLRIGDIIVTDDNKRYVIMNWKPSMKNGYLLRQSFTMKEIDRNSIKYSIPVRS